MSTLTLIIGKNKKIVLKLNNICDILRLKWLTQLLQFLRYNFSKSLNPKKQEILFDLRGFVSFNPKALLKINKFIIKVNKICDILRLKQLKQFSQFLR